MGKSPGKWLKSLLLGKKASKSVAEDTSPTTEREPKEKRRWSFGKLSTQSRGSDLFVDSQCLYTTTDGFCTTLQEQSRRQGPRGGTYFFNSEEGEYIMAAADVPGAAMSTAVSNGVDTTGRAEAAIVIQTAFRGYLARRALRALKGLVRLQALVRGHIVRRQAGTTLQCVQALARVQACVRVRHVGMSKEGQSVQQKLQQRQQLDARPRKSLEGWNSSTGTLQELEAKLQSRQEAAAKRERALAYAFSSQAAAKRERALAYILSSQLSRSAQKQKSVVIDSEHDEPHWGWSWLERWMAARPWETAYLDDHEENPQDRDEGHSEADTENRMHMPASTVVASIQARNPALFESVMQSSVPMSPCPEAENLLPSFHKSPTPLSPMSTPKQLSSSLKQSRSTSFRGNGTQASTVETNGEAMASNGGQVLKGLLLAEPTAAKAKSKLGSNGRGVSGMMLENPSLNSLAVPSYMAATQSAKAKARSQSNPKLRPDPEEKTSPISKKRTPPPAQGKQNRVPWRSFRSASTRGLPSRRAYRW